MTSLATSRRKRAIEIPTVAVLARSATRRGNTVRAAILWTRLANRAARRPTRPSEPRPAPRCETLAVRLRKALFVQKGEASLWVEVLTPLLKLAASGFWSPERRLLYDLQSVCLDHEREIFRLEPVGWLLSLGRRPLKHPLPHLREVVMSKHLRSAAKWLRRVRLRARSSGSARGTAPPGRRTGPR